MKCAMCLVLILNMAKMFFPYTTENHILISFFVLTSHFFFHSSYSLQRTNLLLWVMKKHPAKPLRVKCKIKAVCVYIRICEKNCDYIWYCEFSSSETGPRAVIAFKIFSQNPGIPLRCRFLFTHVNTTQKVWETRSASGCQSRCTRDVNVTRFKKGE